MSWNGSNSSLASPAGKRPAEGASVRPHPSPAAPRTRRGLIAGLIIVAIGSAALLFLTRSRQPSAAPEQPKKPARIAAVTPAVVTNAAPKTEQELHPGMVNVRGKWYPEYNEKGGKIWISANWVRYHSPNVRTNSASLTFEEKIFKNRADREIAVLLNAPPGTPFMGNYTFDKRFERNFLKSLETPIEISADDDERTVALKQAVIDTKKDLKARYDAGEDIVKIMQESYQQMKELGAYREEIRKMVQRVRLENKGKNLDLNDLYGAANKMLSERGAVPLVMPRMFSRNLEVQATKQERKK